MYPSSALDMSEVIAREEDAVGIATKAVNHALEVGGWRGARFVVVWFAHAEGGAVSEGVLLELERVEVVELDVLVRRHRLLSGGWNARRRAGSRVGEREGPLRPLGHEASRGE